MTEVWSLEQLQAELAKPKRNKYGAKSCYCDGVRIISVADHKFLKERGLDGREWVFCASQKEARRFITLRLAEKSGLIRALETQKRYDLEVNGVKMPEGWRCDFRYIEDGKGVVVEDCKGHRTVLYKFKKALMKAIYGIEVRET